MMRNYNAGTGVVSYIDHTCLALFYSLFQFGYLIHILLLDPIITQTKLKTIPEYFNAYGSTNYVI